MKQNYWKMEITSIFLSIFAVSTITFLHFSSRKNGCNLFTILPQNWTFFFYLQVNALKVTTYKFEKLILKLRILKNISIDTFSTRRFFIQITNRPLISIVVRLAYRFATQLWLWEVDGLNLIDANVCLPTSILVWYISVSNITDIPILPTLDAR